MAQFLRTTMKHARSFKFTHDIADLTMTESYIYQIEDTVGVLLLDIQYSAAGCKEAKTIEEDDEGVLIYHAEKIQVRKIACAFSPGQKIFWSGVQGSAVTNVSASGYLWIGICVWAAGASDDTVIIDLKGDKGTHPAG